MKTGPQGFGPDFLRSMMPPEIRQRLGLMNAWPLRMVLAYLDGQARELADYAQKISTYDDDPVVAAGEFAGSFPGTRYSFSVDRTLDLIATMLNVAGIRASTITNTEVTAGVRRLINDLVPADDRDATLAVLDRQPATGPFKVWPIDDSAAELGDLYVVTALAAWCIGNPVVSPSKQAGRRMILRQIHDMESTAHGVPEVERLEVTDQQALELLDAVLGSTDPDFPDFGFLPGQAAINRDPRRRTLVEMEIVEAAKAHLIDHPIRSDDTDRLLRAAIGDAMNGVSTRRHLINTATSRHDMTDTERDRAAKLAAREARRTNGDRPKKRKRQ